MSPSSAPPPRFFVDRSLGSDVVPRLLREAGFEWLADVGAAGLVVLLKDKRIRTRPAEQAAVREHGVRCFCLARGGLTGEAMAAAFVDARRRSAARARCRGRSSSR